MTEFGEPDEAGRPAGTAWVKRHSPASLRFRVTKSEVERDSNHDNMILAMVEP
jgi:hypothetical protein